MVSRPPNTKTSCMRISRLREPLTIPLLLVGIMAGGVGWFVGLVILWSSPIWRTRDKVLGTLLIPGGLPYGLLIALFGLPVVNWNPAPPVGWAILAIVLLGPLYTAGHLTWRLVRVYRNPDLAVG